MKKIFLLLSIVMSILSVDAQKYMTLQFSSSTTVPAVVNDTITNTYHLTSTDTALNSILSGYIIKGFKKRYGPTLIDSSAIAFQLDRVYDMQVQNNVGSLYSNLVSHPSSTISYLGLIDSPKTMISPNDYSYNYSYCEGTTSTGAYLDLINAKDAWDITQGDPNIVIGITDESFDVNHEDLVNKILPSAYTSVYNSVSNKSYHGTIVAGLAACETNNNKGYASIGNKCKVRFYDYNIGSIRKAAEDSCRVVNCSWGWCGDYPPTDPPFIDLIKSKYKIVVVAAAGNGYNWAGGVCTTNGETPGNGLLYPAAYNNVISVSSVGHMYDVGTKNNCQWIITSQKTPNLGYNWKDYHDAWSNARTENESPSALIYDFTHNSSVDLCAPGYELPVLNPNNTYGTQGGSGTSFSAPIVSGTAALILSVNSTFGSSDVESILKCSARDVYEIWENYYYLNKLGAGRIDAGKAVKLATTWMPGTGGSQAVAPSDIRWFDVLSDGTNTVEEEVGCKSVNNTTKCNLGYRLQAVGGNNYKWLVFYSENDVKISSSVKYGNSITLVRGVDYPVNNNANGKISVAVRSNDCTPSNYYAEEKSADCLDPACNYPCSSNVTITGVYTTAITESSTWIKSSGQTTISSTNSVKLDANPASGYVELKPLSNTDFFLAAPSTNIGVFAAQALDGCGGARVNRPAVVKSTSSFLIYPNPASKFFTLSSSKDLRGALYYLYDMSGKQQNIIVENIAKNKKSIKWNSLTKGTYILKVVTKNSTEVEKIIVQ